jgi:hypothetical protein
MWLSVQSDDRSLRRLAPAKTRLRYAEIRFHLDLSSFLHESKQALMSTLYFAQYLILKAQECGRNEDFIGGSSAQQGNQ